MSQANKQIHPFAVSRQVPAFGACLAGTFQVIQTTTAGAVVFLIFVAPGVTFNIVVHVLGEPFTAFHLDGAVHLTVARVLDHARNIAERSAVFLFGTAVFHDLFTFVLFATLQGICPGFLSLGVRELDS